MKLKILSFVLILLIVLTPCTFASEEIVVFVDDGNIINFDVQPQIINSRLMVPVRAIFEELGANVNWNEENMTISATKENTHISMKIGSKYMYVNDAVVELDVQPQIINGRTLVPLRAVSEAFGTHVAWHDGTRATTTLGYKFVHITTYDCYEELAIPLFDYICRENYFDKYDNGEFIVYRYPLAEYGTKDFDDDMGDLSVYDVLLEGYGYTLEGKGGDGDLAILYSKGDQLVYTGYFNGENYSRYVAIRKDEKDIIQKPSNQELFIQEVLKIQDEYFPKINEYEEELQEILDREFEYDPDEDEELQDAMEFAKRKAMRDAVERGKGNSFGMEYAASEAAKSLIPYYEDAAYERFKIEKQDDYNYTVKLINSIIGIYNDKVKELAINYGIRDYASYLIQ